MTYRNLPQQDLAAQFHLKFLLVTQHEVPFMNTSEGTKKMSRTVEVVQAHEPYFTIVGLR